MAKTERKTTTWKRRFFASLVVLLALVLVGGVGLGVAVATTDETDDVLLQAVADYLRENPDSGVAEKALEYLVTKAEKNVSDEEERAGIIRNEKNESPFQRICLKDSGSFRFTCEGWEEITIDTASSTFAEQNLLGRNFIITQAIYSEVDNVSSTHIFSSGTSTTGFVNHYATTTYVNGDGVAHMSNLIPDGIIQPTHFVTSGVAGLADVEGLSGYTSVITGTSTPSACPNRNTRVCPGYGVRVSTTEWVVAFIQSRIDITSTSVTGVCDRADLGQCGPVTTTGRGAWTGRFRYKYLYALDL